MSQYVDEAVSRVKFDAEVTEFRALEAEYRRRGWLLLAAEFPRILVVMCATRPTPPAVITGVSFDYSNYDAEPPSVRLVNPFSGDAYTLGMLPTLLKRRVEGPALALPGLPLGPGGAQPRLVQEQPLMQAARPEDIPFLCIAGVREYHEHPAHTGDSWDLYRSDGAGRLVRLLEVIDTYGVRPIADYNVQLVPRIVGFVQDEVPE